MKSKRIISAAAASLLFITGCTEIECRPPEYQAAAINMERVLYPEAAVSEAEAPETELTETETTPEPEPVTATVSFTALGDNLIHSSLYKQAAARAAADESFEGDFDFRYAYEGAADLLGTADITVLNQETLMCGEGYQLSNYPRFNSPTEVGDYMAELGVDVFTIANNHMLDMGPQGLEDCLCFYDERGYMRAGAYHNAEDRSDIRIMEANGVRVAFLSYTENLNGLKLPLSSELELGVTKEKELMLSEIAAAKEISDICVVSLHWGTENSSVVEDYQRNLANELGEAGVDVIIGNHPHVLREIELIENSDGRTTLCAYSLGNFISAQDVGKNLIGGVLNFDITVSLDDEFQPEFSEIEFIPVITHYDAGFQNVRLYKLSDYTPELADAHGVRKYSKFGYDFICDYLESKQLIKAGEYRGDKAV